MIPKGSAREPQGFHLGSSVDPLRIQDGSEKEPIWFLDGPRGPSIIQESKKEPLWFQDESNMVPKKGSKMDPGRPQKALQGP